MSGRHRRRRGHHRGATLAGITLIAAASVIIIASLAGGVVGVDTPSCHNDHQALVPRSPIILHDEPHGDVPAPRISQERGEAGREPATRESVTANTAIAANGAPVPAPATGFTDDLSQAAHSYMAANAIALQWAIDRQSLIDRITTYMKGVPAASLVPLMVDLGHDYGIDPRLCAVTCIEESSGRGNLFGSLYGHPSGYEEQVRWYYDQITRNGYLDVWHAAWYWHGGGSQGADHSFYADNITRQVEGI